MTAKRTMPETREANKDTISLFDTIEYVINNQKQILSKHNQQKSALHNTLTKEDKRIEYDLVNLELIYRGQHNVIEDKSVLQQIQGSVIRLSMSCKMDVILYERRVSDTRVMINTAKHRITMLNPQLSTTDAKNAANIKNALAEAKQYIAEKRIELDEYTVKLSQAQQHLTNMKKIENNIYAHIESLSINK